MPPDTSSASSHATGIILMVVVTVIIAGLILAQFIQVPARLYYDEVPTVFEITALYHAELDGKLNYKSYMVVKNSGKIAYDNRKLYAKTYRNGKLLPCIIRTMNGHDYVPSHHFGIQKMGGFGTEDFFWVPTATLYIDYSDGTFHPGDIIMFEVYDRTTNQIISRDTWPHTSGNTKKWMDLLFNHQVV
ncbi:MAG: hypothetical protein M0Q92_03630 [Methanoregula sp.]|nr:hypothetical protein [Methanoregula sp.]